jgi:WD40 repeat protein
MGATNMFTKTHLEGGLFIVIFGIVLTFTGCITKSETYGSIFLAVDTQGYNDLVISPSGQYIAVGNHSGAFVYRVGSEEVLWYTEGDVTALRFTKDEEYLAIAKISLAEVRDTESGTLYHEIPACSGGTVFAISLLGQGTQLACGSGSGDEAGILRVWNLRDKEQVFLALTDVPDGAINTIEESPNGSTIATIGSRQEIALWNSNTGQLVASLNVYDFVRSQDVMVITEATFNPSGDLIAAGYTDGTLIIWDVEKQQAIEKRQQRLGAIHSLVWSHDGRLLAGGTQDGHIIVWDGQTFQPIEKLRSHQDRVVSLAFTSDDTVVISASEDGEIILHTLK